MRATYLKLTHSHCQQQQQRDLFNRFFVALTFHFLRNPRSYYCKCHWRTIYGAGYLPNPKSFSVETSSVRNAKRLIAHGKMPFESQKLMQSCLQIEIFANETMISMNQFQFPFMFTCLAGIYGSKAPQKIINIILHLRTFSTYRNHPPTQCALSMQQCA